MTSETITDGTVLSSQDFTLLESTIDNFPIADQPAQSPAVIFPVYMKQRAQRPAVVVSPRIDTLNGKPVTDAFNGKPAYESTLVVELVDEVTPKNEISQWDSLKKSIALPIDIALALMRSVGFTLDSDDDASTTRHRLANAGLMRLIIAAAGKGKLKPPADSNLTTVTDDELQRYRQYMVLSDEAWKDLRKAGWTDPAAHAGEDGDSDWQEELEEFKELTELTERMEGSEGAEV